MRPSTVYNSTKSARPPRWQRIEQIWTSRRTRLPLILVSLVHLLWRVAASFNCRCSALLKARQAFWTGLNWSVGLFEGQRLGKCQLLLSVSAWAQVLKLSRLLLETLILRPKRHRSCVPRNFGLFIGELFGVGVIHAGGLRLVILSIFERAFAIVVKPLACVSARPDHTEEYLCVCMLMYIDNK